MRHVSIVLLLIVSLHVTRSQTASGDFFPFALAMSRTYEFVSEEKTYFSLIQQTHTKDSGVVRFVIDDLRYTDTTIVWSITQIQNLVRRFEDLAHNLPETTYFIQDTVLCEMTEWRTGDHRLASSGQVNRVWQFPRRWYTDTNVWSWTITPDIHRYAPSTWRHVVQSDSQIASVWTYSDTLSFIEGVGLEYYKSWTLKGPNTPYYLVWSAKLVDPVLSVGNSRFLTDDMPALLSTYPNPFNSTTHILVIVRQRQTISVEIFDVLGRRVSQLHNGEVEAGERLFHWNAHGFPSGAYFCKLKTPGQVLTQRLLLAQ